MKPAKTLRVRTARPDVQVRRAGAISQLTLQPDGETYRDSALIYPGEVVEVPDERYYRERIRKGDLELVSEQTHVDQSATGAPERQLAEESQATTRRSGR